MNFLMVGHTHKDIDGLFDMLSGKMAHSHALPDVRWRSCFNQSQQTVSKPQQQGGAARDYVKVPVYPSVINMTVIRVRVNVKVNLTVKVKRNVRSCRL